MSWLEKRGRTVDEAVAAALEELALPEDAVEIEVLAEGQKGLLGRWGVREAHVRVRPRRRKVEAAVAFVRDVTRTMGLDAQVEGREVADGIWVEIRGRDLGRLIGRRGRTLDALQYLVNLVVARRHEDRRPVIVDVEGYRRRRRDALEDLAVRMALRARRLGRAVSLGPMAAAERRVIHLALQDHPEVSTHSEGEEPLRRVIITPRPGNGAAVAERRRHDSPIR